MKYADVILPLPLEDSYTYIIPAEMEAAVVSGCRVIVHFGKRKYYTAIVMEVHSRAPRAGVRVKEIFALLDAGPVLRPPQLRFWRWIASYYICKQGDVLKAALPSGMKMESETVVKMRPDFSAEGPLRGSEQAVLDAFGSEGKLSVADIEKRTGIHNVVPVVAQLMTRGAVEVCEELGRGFKPKTETMVRLAAGYADEERLQETFVSLRRAKKQVQLLECFLGMSHDAGQGVRGEVPQKELMERSGCTPSVMKGLLAAGVLECYEREVGRLRTTHCDAQPLNALSTEQERACGEIHDVFKEKDVCLLHGVTSSGKTEIYARLIDETLAAGRQVLYMLPEIAITTQITERLARVFPGKLIVYHSKFSDNERVEVWHRLLESDAPMVVLGVRSSVFLPFARLGLVIVDEEHESTYKQQDPAPRYHARNAAIVLAAMHGAKTLLGSATPSIDSYYNAMTGKYGLVSLTTRYGGCLMPEITVVDVKELRRKKIMKDTLFSPLLVDKMRAALDGGEQVILFQNRRGFAPMMECRACGWVPHCVNCDVSLTYHKHTRQLTCHYCGYTVPLPAACPECGSAELRMMGFGTEKVEEEVSQLFPDAKADRLDMDTARTRSAYERIISDFEQGRTQILIGTQMLSKGLDFGSVSVVGILSADSLMNYPDFRAHERAFQLMVQVGGRAGRRDRQGTVVLQTSHPEHPLISMVRRGAYDEMVRMQLGERSLFRYPPFQRLIVIVLRSRSEAALQEMARLYAEKLRRHFGERVLGPTAPPVTRMYSLLIRKIVLKIEVSAPIAPVREALEKVHTEMQSCPEFRRLLVHYDVDPA